MFEHTQLIVAVMNLRHCVRLINSLSVACPCPGAVDFMAGLKGIIYIPEWCDLLIVWSLYLCHACGQDTNEWVKRWNNGEAVSKLSRISSWGPARNGEQGDYKSYEKTCSILNCSLWMSTGTVSRLFGCEYEGFDTNRQNIGLRAIKFKV